jgi:hypothetical protein
VLQKLSIAFVYVIRPARRAHYSLARNILNLINTHATYLFSSQALECLQCNQWANPTFCGEVDTCVYMDPIIPIRISGSSAFELNRVVLVGCLTKSRRMHVELKVALAFRDWIKRRVSSGEPFRRQTLTSSSRSTSAWCKSCIFVCRYCGSVH